MPKLCVSCGGKPGRLATAGRAAEIACFGYSTKKEVKYKPFNPATNTCGHCIKNNSLQ